MTQTLLRVAETTIVTHTITYTQSSDELITVSSTISVAHEKSVAQPAQKSGWFRSLKPWLTFLTLLTPIVEIASAIMQAQVS